LEVPLLNYLTEDVNLVQRTLSTKELLAWPAPPRPIIEEVIEAVEEQDVMELWDVSKSLFKNVT
jgi:hypothetical protein